MSTRLADSVRVEIFCVLNCSQPRLKLAMRWAAGFMATYWGYKTMQEVEQYMHEFRDRQLPIDSFIMDYVSRTAIQSHPAAPAPDCGLLQPCTV